MIVLVIWGEPPNLGQVALSQFCFSEDEASSCGFSGFFILTPCSLGTKLGTTWWSSLFYCTGIASFLSSWFWSTASRLLFQMIHLSPLYWGILLWQEIALEQSYNDWSLYPVAHIVVVVEGMIPYTSRIHASSFHRWYNFFLQTSVIEIQLHMILVLHYLHSFGNSYHIIDIKLDINPHLCFFIYGRHYDRNFLNLSSFDPILLTIPCLW